MEIAPAVLASHDSTGNQPSASSSSTASTGGSREKENQSNTGMPSRYDDDDDEEEDVCRICRNPGDTENPLRYPCACSGSIKFVHQDCLLQWLNHSNARQCEVCKHPFSFSPVYAENAPARLPFQEFIVGMAMKACHVLQFFLRLSFVLSVWLVIIPFITFWIWRLAFVRSFGEAQKLFLSHISTTVILTDCLHGFLLSASIVFIFLGATSLRDYFRHLREIGGQDADRDDDGDRNGARAARRPPGQANRNLVGDGNGEDAAGAQGIAGAGQMIRRNAENVAARWEIQAARLEAHVEQMFDGLDDADGAEDVPFDELVGMQGPVFHLVENAFTVLASNMIFLGVVIFVPFSLGRVIHHYLSWLLSSATTSPVLSTVVPLTEQALSLANITLKNALTAVANLTSDNQDSSLLGQVADMLKANATGIVEASNNATTPLSDDMLKGASIGTSRLSDVTTLAVGYMFIFSLVIFYLGVVAIIRYTKGEPLTMGRFYGLASIAETIPSLFRQLLAAMRHLMTMIKVAFLLVIELGVFPLMCGWWLDLCTIRMFGKSIAHRVEFFSASPLASSLIHWFVGIVYMLQISIFVSLLRGVLRTGVLYFLRDPADPNYNPFRDLIDDPVHKHARRVLLSVAVYGSLIVMLVFLPVKLAMRMAPSIFPLDISVSDPFTEIPADMLLFQICIPFAIEHFKLRATIKSLLRYWFTGVGWALGLTDFLLPRPEDIGGPENGIIDPVRQDRLRAQQGGQDRALVGYVAADEINRARLANIVDEFDGEEQSDSDRYGFVLRIVLLLLVAWMTLLILNSAIVVVPISLGRALFNAVPLLPITHGIKCNDIYAFVIGSYVIWTALAGVRYSIDQIKTRRARVLLGQIWKWFGIVMKSSALLSIWVLGSASCLSSEANLVEPAVRMEEIEDWETSSARTSDSEVTAPDSNDEENCYASSDLPKLQFRKQMSTARWKEELGMAEVVSPKGKWTTTGLVRNGKIYCTVDETLYLAEIGALHLLDNDDRCLTLKDLYKKVSEGKGGCCWDSFEVYRHMKKYGYVVQRHGVPWSMKSAKTKSTSVEGNSNINVTVDEGYEDDGFISELFSSIQINEVRTVFDVYPPNSKFKKSSPGKPTCVLCLTSVRPPSKPDIEELERQCNGIPPKLCNVDNGRVNFISFDRVELPVLP